ncbi:putative gustatory receptor 28b [Tribolium castaneum]|uniref:Gustatory receptor n=1 Tax=Tribolium castaneum TaxID=7070 RepID=D6WR29_TRICA|nr:PREDICTED: putative gustatory receptor 28b [Tribolium castaneum]EFA07632.1 gustatory receptor 154 [Tribolium castaneum]|eukprot:XP_015837372.1 PREDICTED: putative gustatory receptor 28b [Tribolium castaneum]
MSTQDIYDAVYPLLLTTASFGLSAIFVETKNNTRKLAVFNLLKILNIIYLSLFSALLYVAFTSLKNTHLHVNYNSGVTKIGIIFQILANIMATYVIYFINISKSHNILTCIENIKKADLMFRDLGEKIIYRKHFLYEVCMILFGVLAILGRSIVTHIYMGRNIFLTENETHFALFFPLFVSYLVQINFVLLITLVHERFALINRLLDNFNEEKVKHNYLSLKPPYEYQTKYNQAKIELLMELHDFLTDVGNKLNDSFSIQILSCLTSQFLTEVFTIFYLYYESLILKNKIAALVWLMWSIWTTLEIFYVTVNCHLTTKEAKNTGIAIHKVLMNESDPDAKRKLMVFSQQVNHRSLQFTACGLFYIDATLIFTIVGAAATYLLIMLQFQEGIEAQCSNNTLLN